MSRESVEYFKRQSAEARNRELLRLLAVAIKKHGPLVLDVDFYKVPLNPVLLTRTDQHGQVVVELQE